MQLVRMTLQETGSKEGSNGPLAKETEGARCPPWRDAECVAKTEAAVLRQAIADADWDNVEHCGGLDAVVDKIDQAEEETVAAAGAGWIDNFRLWGSRRWRRINAPLKKT